MEEIKIRALIARYNQGIADDAEKSLLEQMVEDGLIQLEDFNDIHSLHNELLNTEVPSPSQKLDEHFYAMLRNEKKKINPLLSIREFFAWPQVMVRLGTAVILLLIGVAVGRYFVPEPTVNGQVENLRQEIGDLKEMMMLSLLEKDEATERLKAVNLTQDMREVSAKVTHALFQTLNQDANVNVRLAALEALKPYAYDSGIREELIRSIVKQDSPLVQIALAELMAALQEKSSLKELEKILQDEKTPADVKKKIQETINIMI